MKPIIAITNNPAANGHDSGGTVWSIQSALLDLNTKPIEINYRDLTPAHVSHFDDIYTDKNKLIQLFKYAKQQANKLLQDKDCLILSGNSAMIDPRMFGQPFN